MFGKPEAPMLGVAEGLDEQNGEVGICEAVVDARAVAAWDDEVRVPEGSEVAADGALRLAELIGEVADSVFPILEGQQQSEPGRIRQGLEERGDELEVSGLGRERKGMMVHVKEHIRISGRTNVIHSMGGLETRFLCRAGRAAMTNKASGPEGNQPGGRRTVIGHGVVLDGLGAESCRRWHEAMLAAHALASGASSPSSADETRGAVEA